VPKALFQFFRSKLHIGPNPTFSLRPGGCWRSSALIKDFPYMHFVYP
jgi:hypothetical protein